MCEKKTDRQRDIEIGKLRERESALEKESEGEREYFVPAFDSERQK